MTLTITETNIKSDVVATFAFADPEDQTWSVDWLESDPELTREQAIQAMTIAGEWAQLLTDRPSRYTEHPRWTTFERLTDQLGMSSDDAIAQLEGAGIHDC